MKLKPKKFKIKNNQKVLKLKSTLVITEKLSRDLCLLYVKIFYNKSNHML